jgi:hypothetical protein
VSKELREKLIYAVAGLALGLVTSYAAVWRDVAVIRVELAHQGKDLDLVRRFIVSPEPKDFKAAKAELLADEEAAHK